MKDIFRFSRGERIASLILLVLTLVVLLMLAYVRRIHPLPAEEVRELDSLISVVLPAEEAFPGEKKQPAPAGRARPSHQKKTQASLPVRDPNTMTREEWEALRLPPGVIRTLLNYRNKGGVFRKKEDVKKIYGMTDSLYRAISPYLSVRMKEQEERSVLPDHKPATEPVVFPLVEINSADSAALDSLPGIPPFLARRIVRYRYLLGGFVRKEQLLEVYGLDSLTYGRIEKRITVDTLHLRKINVNSCDEYTLSHHPYLSRQEAGAVIFYREHFGRIDNLSVLREQKVLPERTFTRILPYLETGTEK